MTDQVVLNNAGEVVQRFVSSDKCLLINALISSGDLSYEAGFRLLYPEETDRIFDIGNHWGTSHQE